MEFLIQGFTDLLFLSACKPCGRTCAFAHLRVWMSKEELPFAGLGKLRGLGHRRPGRTVRGPGACAVGKGKQAGRGTLREEHERGKKRRCLGGSLGKSRVPLLLLQALPGRLPLAWAEAHPSSTGGTEEKGGRGQSLQKGQEPSPGLPACPAAQMERPGPHN